ncbi:MAG: cbb3-type cytochrome c oxidase subunit 3 [Magnetococcales bacterium]|nr:cbb3-type cytochrome c oxidase subunit 3 [Magnetococcales bacterium]
MLSFSKQFSLIWFFLLFVAVVAWAYWPSHKKRFEDQAGKLLEEDPVHNESARITETDRHPVDKNAG